VNGAAWDARRGLKMHDKLLNANGLPERAKAVETTYWELDCILGLGRCGIQRAM